MLSIGGKKPRTRVVDPVAPMVQVCGGGCGGGCGLLGEAWGWAVIAGCAVSLLTALGRPARRARRCARFPARGPACLEGERWLRRRRLTPIRGGLGRVESS